MGWDVWVLAFLFGGIGVYLYLGLLACEHRRASGLKDLREILRKKAEYEKQKEQIRSEILQGKKSAAEAAVESMAREKPRAVAGLIEKIMTEKQGAGKPAAA